MKQKIILLITTMVLAISVTACGQQPDEKSEETSAVEEVTTEKTICEKNGHTWVEATCTEPKTCSVCGATEGEPLGHTFLEATYLQGQTCEVCGEVEGEPLQPTASIKDISDLQEKVNSLVETYNASNQEAIDAVAEYLTSNGEDSDEFVQKMEEIFDAYGRGTNDSYWYTAIPMAFYYNMQEGGAAQYTLEDFVNMDSDSTQSYLEVAQADKNHMTTGGILLCQTMIYIREIATGNPVVLDVIHYDEPLQINTLNLKLSGIGIIEANGKLFVADLTEGNMIANIFPEEETFRPLQNSTKEECDTTVDEVNVTGGMEYELDEDGKLYFTAKNIGDTFTASYKGYIGYFSWVQEEGDDDTNSIPATGDELYNMYFGE